MKLMDVLNEVRLIEKKEMINEARKKEIKQVRDKINKSLKNKSGKAEILAKKLKAKKGSINWSDDTKEVRNAIVAAFVSNDTEKVIEMMVNPTDGYKVIEILKAIETAHGGYEKLEAVSGKAGKKDFIKTIFAYIKETEKEESKDSEEKK